MLQLKISEKAVCSEAKPECQFEADVATIAWVSDELANGPNKPNLGHA